MIEENSHNKINDKNDKTIKTIKKKERPYEVIFRGKIVGRYNADLVVNQTVILELKCCDSLIAEHQAQLFNYLRVAALPIGLLVNFRRRKLEWKRLQSNDENFDKKDAVEEAVPFEFFQ